MVCVSEIVFVVMLAASCLAAGFIVAAFITLDRME
jgi:hypothetical protein